MKDVAVVYEEIEESGEAESEQVAPDDVPSKQNGEELEEEHLDDETADAAAEIAEIMPPKGGPTAPGDAVAPDEEIGDGEIGQRSADERDGRREDSFSGIAVEPQMRTHPKDRRIYGRTDEGGGGKGPQAEKGMSRRCHSFFLGSGSISEK